MINHTLGAKHFASGPFKSDKDNAHLCKSLCCLWLELACVSLLPKVTQTSGGGWCQLINLPCFVLFCIFLPQMLWRSWNFYRIQEWQWRLWFCSLCCWLQRARSDETDLKITSPEIICIFSHVLLLYLEPPTTASAIYSIFFFQQKGCN